MRDVKIKDNKNPKHLLKLNTIHTSTCKLWWRGMSAVHTEKNMGTYSKSAGCKLYPSPLMCARAAFGRDQWGPATIIEHKTHWSRFSLNTQNQKPKTRLFLPTRRVGEDQDADLSAFGPQTGNYYFYYYKYKMLNLTCFPQLVMSSKWDLYYGCCQCRSEMCPVFERAFCHFIYFFLLIVSMLDFPSHMVCCAESLRCAPGSPEPPGEAHTLIRSESCVSVLLWQGRHASAVI